ncbi:MAG: hypothetical protein MI867_02250, partial [Pseudomonadales bacterium]|nr:hypothetical protein [Pseudomonadales bacterium]
QFIDRFALSHRFPRVLDQRFARFCKQHDCAEIVSERSHEALVVALRRLLSDEKRVAELAANSLKAAQPFSRDLVRETFVEHINKV